MITPLRYNKSEKPARKDGVGRIVIWPTHDMTGDVRMTRFSSLIAGCDHFGRILFRLDFEEIY